MIKDFFTTDIWLKLASLMLAIALWFFVILGGRAGVNIDIPIKYINLPENLEVLEPQKMVKVSLEGQERLLKNIKHNEISAVIDLSDVKAGTSFFTLSKENIKVPRALRVIKLDPETISLTIENHLKKSVQVKPAIIGLPAKDYAIVEIKVDPELILIEGPRSIISSIYSIQTEPIDITGIKRDLFYKARVNLSGSNIQKNVQKVKIRISVKKIQ